MHRKVHARYDIAETKREILETVKTAQGPKWTGSRVNRNFQSKN